MNPNHISNIPIRQSLASTIGLTSRPTAPPQESTAMSNPYQSRLTELRHHAQDENIPWNHHSETDFQTFITANSHWRKALLGLANNGNLRATWRADDGSHLALQFLGHGDVEFVMFKQRHESASVSRATGHDTSDFVVFKQHRETSSVSRATGTVPWQEVPTEVHAFDLTRLVCPPPTAL